MEVVTDLIQNNIVYALPAVLVIFLILVYAFGFKRAEQPPFDKLFSGANDDRKTAGKKRKIKEKVSSDNCCRPP